MSPKTIITGALVFAAGAATGGFAVYKYLVPKLEAEIREDYKQAMDELRESYKNREEYIHRLRDEEAEPETMNETPRGVPLTPEMLDEVSEEPQMPEEYATPRKTMREIEREAKEPYVISSEEFELEMPHYDKITLLYFEKDDTLADEGEETIPDPESYIGPDALTSFGEKCEDPDVVYVRNASVGADYEVIRIKSSYAESVLGLRDEAPKPKKRRAIRRDEE